MELDDFTHERIEALSELGNASVNAGDYAEAISRFEEALSLLPEPIAEWEAATWLLTAIGEAHFFSKQYLVAYQALARAMHCAGAIGNPFIHLRLGQVQFELENEGLAADELTRAYMGGGKEIFAREGSKYFEFLKTRVDEPPNGW